LRLGALASPGEVSMSFKRGQLRYFVAVAEAGQITRAAEKLHLAQPALSQTIAQLEYELGIKLLERHARGVTLTPAGEVFLVKARAAVSATDDVALTARSLARAAKNAMTVGFVGVPPSAKAPQLFTAFTDAYPEAELSFRELGFPQISTAAWLEEVDVALCFSPTPHRGVGVEVLRAEPRIVIASDKHRLARHGELAVAEVLDETFLGCHPAVEPAWAGFWRLDDHRGAPAAHVTADRALNAWEMVALAASGHAITTVAASNTATVPRIVAGVTAIPLRDAHPALLSLVWRKDYSNPLVDALIATARELAEAGASASRAGVRLEGMGAGAPRD
jgi:DNA-binding transcriptional LysR family regulator